ncbi:MAG: ribosomal protein S18 acetylase RimI-like enzyme [Myxococcota bacterium]|jgi:ribosomal protein S18 acetylase RimI-like enzyme
MSLQIEHATLSDAAELLELHRNILEEGRYFITSAEEFHDSLERQRAIMRQLISQDSSCQLLARQDGRLVGMVLIRGGFLARMAHVGKLEIFLSADCRGKGLGWTLMVAALDWARDQAVLRKIGLTVFEDNTRAVGLYRALDFEVEGRRVGEYREPDGTLRSDLLMWLAV